LRKALDRIEGDLAENRRETDLASAAAIAQLGIVQGEERFVKVGNETWRVLHTTAGLRVIPQALDEDI
jgi:hypothetical protein